MRVLFLNLALILAGMWTAVDCCAEGVATPQAASGPGNDTLPCTVDSLYPCLFTSLSSQTTSASNTGWQGIDFDPQPKSDRELNAGWQTPTQYASNRDVNFSLDSMGAGINTSMGRLAFSMTLDNNYHGALYNYQDLLEPFQLSFRYGLAW